MRILRNIGLLLAVLALQGCPGGYGYKYNTGTFPSSPVNFAAINSEYDDYNMSSPILGEDIPLCFSSTRNSRGEDFDIVYKFISIEFSKTTGELSILENSAVKLEAINRSRNLNEAVSKVNNSYNELGPYVIHLMARLMKTGITMIL